jgi:hypothetical protein
MTFLTSNPRLDSRLLSDLSERIEAPQAYSVVFSEINTPTVTRFFDITKRNIYKTLYTDLAESWRRSQQTIYTSFFNSNFNTSNVQFKESILTNITNSILLYEISYKSISPTYLELHETETQISKLVRYLRRISEGDENTRFISSGMANMAWEAWLLLSEATDERLSVPTASPGPDGELLFHWRSGQRYLELEIFEERPAEFFYNDEGTDELFGCEYVIGQTIPSEIKERLVHFTGIP